MLGPVTTFAFNQFPDTSVRPHDIRCVTVEGEPWFVGADVLTVLGCPKAHRHMWLTKLDADEKGNSSFVTPGGSQKMTTVSESGLYKLIMRCRKPIAKPFQDWVTKEVIPSIRKTGGYKLEEGQTIPLPGTFAEALRGHAEALIKLAEAEEARAVTEAARKAAEAA